MGDSLNLVGRHRLFKSTFNAANFIRYAGYPGLSSDFGAIHRCSKSFKVIDVGTTRELVKSACYDKQQVCVYLQTLFAFEELIARFRTKGSFNTFDRAKNCLQETRH